MRVSQPRVQFFPLAIVSIFIVLGIIGIARHEMWRDELQAWLIARDSVSLIDLFRNLRYEGHPGLWHLMIYACIKLKKEPFVMQLLHLAIASTSVFLIVRYSPFTNLQKTLISFGYFIFYEYSIISRNYAIAVLLIFLLCILYKKRFNQIFIYFIILGLLANTNIYGWMISISFTSALVLDFILTNFKSELQIKIRKLISFLPGFVFYLVAAAASLMLMLPPSDRGRGTEFLVQFDLKHVLETSSIVWTSYIPVPKKTFRFWETNFFLDNEMLDFNVRYWTVAIIACFMVLGIAILFATKSRNAAIIYLSGTALILIFSYTKFSGSIRHHGNLFILLLACVWIALTETNIPKSLTRKWVVKISSIAKIAFTLLLFSHMLSSIWPYYSDLSSPFTMNQVTAQYIRRKYLKPESADRFMIAGYRNSQTSGLSALLNTRLYYLQNEDYASFVVWNQKNLREMQDTEILDTAIDESVRVNKPCILVLTHKLDETLLQRYQNNGEVELSYLKSFTGSIVKSERFHLYKITRNPSTTLGSDVPKS